jgi:hypothetical protein
VGCRANEVGRVGCEADHVDIPGNGIGHIEVFEGWSIGGAEDSVSVALATNQEDGFCDASNPEWRWRKRKGEVGRVRRGGNAIGLNRGVLADEGLRAGWIVVEEVEVGREAVGCGVDVVVSDFSFAEGDVHGAGNYDKFGVCSANGIPEHFEAVVLVGSARLLVNCAIQGAITLTQDPH